MAWHPEAPVPCPLSPTLTQCLRVVGGTLCRAEPFHTRGWCPMPLEPSKALQWPGALRPQGTRAQASEWPGALKCTRGGAMTTTSKGTGPQRWSAQVILPSQVSILLSGKEPKGSKQGPPIKGSGGG